MAPTYSNGQEMVSIYLIKIKITTKFFKSVVGRDCFRILKNLEITDADCKDPAKCIKGPESYFKQTQNEIYEHVLLM